MERSSAAELLRPTAMILSFVLVSGVVAAAETGSRAGHGHFGVGYQYIKVDGFEATTGTLDIGTTDAHSLNFDFEYYLTDRWALSAGLPLVRKRYTGPFPHDPLLLAPPRPEVENVDDGQYRTEFQDLHLGVRYLALDGPLQIEPFAYYGWPTNDYPFFGHAAVGQNLWKFDLGASFTYSYGLSDAYYRADIAYVFVEETLGYSINHWRVNLEVGYFFKPRLTGKVFMMIKEGDGLLFPDDFPPPRTTEKWYQHDRLVRHNYINAGVGVDWGLNEKYVLSGAVLTMVHADQVHIMDYTWGFTLSRSF